MDVALLFSTTNSAIPTLSCLLVFLIILWTSKSIIGKSGKKKIAPEAGGSWPIIGHLHLLRGPKPPHVVLGDMVDNYGPIFTIKMGVYRALVVSNWEYVKECFTTNDRVFASRPKTLALEVLAYGGSMFGLSPYGPFWSQVRKIAAVELLSNQRLEMFKGTRESEVRTSIKELHKLWEQRRNGSNKALVELKRWFTDITINVILKIIVAKSVGYETTEEKEEQSSHQTLKQLLREFFEMTGRFVLSDALPCLRLFDIGGHEKNMKRIAKELDIFAKEWLKKHKQNIATVDGERDFMDLMLHIVQDADAFPGRDPDTLNKATCLDLILGASDTTAVTLTWALALLVNSPSVMEKAQKEVDMYAGRERQVEEADLKNLVYLQAVVKETLRLYPAGPLSVPHESMEDCTIADYHIPAGTRLFVNIWKIHRDPRVWSNPCNFEPERFLTTHRDLDVHGKNFEYIPFGTGRRMCPGVSFALQVVQLTLAKLLQGFNFATPTGERVDMTESIGLTDMKATPLKVLIEPRLTHHLYD
ncbi:hypothetical protein K2173_027742 [Erythroxylum novogranatense]|uniref:Cytochrome P450 n=1 Tax=Erythroxylum novogranatense TaxID=1862640 RepID=A0AAV8U2F7_9ROSI|nr:hypothetical protein K2173_027742 [Erythroxylum novogranatense]